MAETATIWVTVLIAVNRYIIVCLPLRASQWCTLPKVKIQLTVVLVWAVIYNIPQICRYRVVHNNGTSYVTRFEMGPPSFPQFYYVYDIVLSFIVLVCLPMFILTLLTVLLIKAMKAHRRMQTEMQRQHSQPDSSMTFALVIVVIVVIICRAPLLVWSVVLLLEYRPISAMCIVDITYFTLLTLNSAVNFVIYIFSLTDGSESSWLQTFVSDVQQYRWSTLIVLLSQRRSHVKRVISCVAVTPGFRFVSTFKPDNHITVR